MARTRFQKDRENFLARVRRKIAKGLDLEISQFYNIANSSELKRAISKFDRIVKPKSSPIKKSFSTKKAGLKSRSPKVKKILPKLQTKIDKFIEDVREYNRKFGIRGNSKKFYYSPTSENDLKKGREILNQLEWGNYKKAGELLKVDFDNDTIASKSYRDDVFKNRKLKLPSFKDRIFLKTSIEEAQKSQFPELANILQDGGIDMLNELVSSGFTLVEYSNSFTDRETSDRDVIIKKLNSASKRFKSKTNRVLIDTYIKNIK